MLAGQASILKKGGGGGAGRSCENSSNNRWAKRMFAQLTHCSTNLCVLSLGYYSAQWSAPSPTWCKYAFSRIDHKLYYNAAGTCTVGVGMCAATCNRTTTNHKKVKSSSPSSGSCAGARGVGTTHRNQHIHKTRVRLKPSC